MRKTRQKQVVIGLIQMEADTKLDSNLEQAVRKIKSAAAQGSQIISLQELFCTPYFPQEKSHRYFDWAESIPGPTTRLLSRLARQLKVVIIAPIFERHSSSRYYNTAVLMDADGTIIGTYRKAHLPNDPCYYEQFYFKRGNSGFKSYQTKYGRIGVLICWDQWFPEAARSAALSGAQILFYPSAIGWLASEEKSVRLKEKAAWETIQRAHAIANGIYVAAINRVGREGKLTFWGSSFVADPFGKVLVQGSVSGEEVLIASCDLMEIDRVRRAWPFIQERRVDAY